MKRIHFAGYLKYITSDGWSREIFAGWAACCSGPIARRIRADGNHSHNSSEVTCKSCLRVLAAAAKK
jgi:hypothetical protein